MRIPISTARLRGRSTYGLCLAASLLAGANAPAQTCVGNALNTSAPPTATITVNSSDPTALFTLFESLSFTVNTAPVVVEVAGGPYDAFRLDPDAFPNGLTIYATSTVASANPVIIDGGGTDPCIQLTEFISTHPGGGLIQIGWAQSTNKQNWNGFVLQNGAAPGTNPAIGFDGGGGILAWGTDSRLEIRGNEIRNNKSLYEGGGIALYECDALVAINDIWGNTVGEISASNFVIDRVQRGAGVYQNRGQLDLVGNLIHDNGFDSHSYARQIGAVVRSRQGGGLASLLSDASGGQPDPRLSACGNVIFDNNATEGGGMWVDMEVRISNATARIDSNRILGNDATWLPSSIPSGFSFLGAHQGGGIWLFGDSDSPGGGGSGDSGGAIHSGGGTPKVGGPINSILAEVYNNLLDHNTVDGSGTGAAGPAQDCGGGIFADFALRDAQDRLAFQGNAVIHNDTARHGGGQWLYCPDFSPGSNLAAVLYHNTWTFNTALPADPGFGLYMATPTSFDGSSNIIYFNDQGATNPNPNWFAEFGVSTEMRFTQMTSGYPGGVDLYGNPATNNNDDADPVFAAGDPVHIDEGSPCIDTAEPSLLNPPMDIAVDFEQHPRVIAQLSTTPIADRGADEFRAFRRGDANADGCINVADVQFILNFLFSMGAAPVCMDAADVNDNGSIEIGDSVRLLDFLFSSGPPPAAPFASCGNDPTPDSLPTGVGTPCFVTCP